MLSRVADSLYWMSRYLERAEHTARMLDVTLHQMLDQTPESAGRRWDRLIACLRVSEKVRPARDAYHVTEALTFDQANRDSITGCIVAARENARQVREMISSEMWEQLNRLYLGARGATMEQIWNHEPHAFFRAVKEGAHLFQGITDATLSHGEGWHFIQVGRYLERASATAMLLDVHFNTPLALPQASITQIDYLEWVGVLKSCTAFEAYCKVYTAEIKPACILEFLLLNAEFPRSVRFSVDAIASGLQAIARSTGSRNAGRVDRLAGRLRASLDYGQVDEIMADNMHAYLEQIRRRCAEIHTAIHQTYIAYPVESALAS